jgi:hypothetical protein
VLPLTSDFPLMYLDIHSWPGLACQLMVLSSKPNAFPVRVEITYREKFSIRRKQT